MHKQDYLVRLDPDKRGLDYFDYLLEVADRKEIFAKYFEFLDMTLADIGTFDRDFALWFESDGMTLIIMNADKEEFPNFCVDGYLDFVRFAFDSNDKVKISSVVEKIKSEFDIFEVKIQT